MSEAGLAAAAGGSRAGSLAVPVWVKGLVPLSVLGALAAVFLRFGPIGVFPGAFPPVEELTIERITLPRPGEIQVRVVNGGPEPSTIAQVLVDDAVWTHRIDGDRTLGRLERRTITIPYPWVEGEPHEVSLMTRTGLTFTGRLGVATRTPVPDRRYIGALGLLGVYGGVIPVLLGLSWLPFLRALRRRWLDFFLCLTIGLLAYLAVDALAAALEGSTRVPGAFQGPALVPLGALGTPLIIATLRERKQRAGTGPLSPRSVAGLVAVGVGLHNLGEGLAIGSAYATGEIALGTALAVGFLLHNSAQGLGIAASTAEAALRPGQLALLGAVAGVPAVLGTWIGGFSSSPLWTTLVFAVGGGAILQAIAVLWRFLARRAEGRFAQPLHVAGLVLGLLVMYFTGLAVPV